MKKIVFADIPMKEMIAGRDGQCYARTGNAGCTYKGTVVYPINAVLAEKMKAGDDMKVVLLKTMTQDGNAEKNAELFRQELDAINAGIGARIAYEMIDTDFVETKENHEKRLRAMLAKIEDGAQLYADITFGQKPLPMVLMCVLHFAEKFFDADIKKIVYGKVDFVRHDDGKSYPENPELYDVTSLYYLNGLVGAMEAPSGEAALKALDAFFAL
ncbi:MAG: hypothetical protein K2N31_01920 [Treponemataceae bacterium]|nr:hypothetical protein [Treponemataceae bacterium]